MSPRVVVSLLLVTGLCACGGRVLPVTLMETASTVSAMGAGPAAAVDSPEAALEKADSRIVAQVKAGLAADPELGERIIDVDSKEGLVVLAGVAPDAAARERATAIARQVPEVRRISNQLDLSAG